MVLFRKKADEGGSKRTVQLTVVEGNNETGDLPGTVFPLETGNNVIGRDPLCDVRLGSGTVSRRHASIRVSYDKRKFQIRDLGSSNGVLIGSETVLKKGRKTLDSGDEFQVGEIRLRLHTIDDEETLETLLIDAKDLVEPDGRGS